MDTRNGQIYAADELGNLHPRDREYLREMGHHPTPTQRAENKVGRNDPCPCGSGMKFKRCCLFGGRSVTQGTDGKGKERGTP